jgi:hypothetical protein
MFILDWLSPHNPTAISAKLCLLKTRMHSFQTMQSLFEWLGQAIVRLNLISKQRIAANLRCVEESQKGHSWWLRFI